MKGQATIEFLAMFLVMLIVISLLVTAITSQTQSYKEKSKILEAKEKLEEQAMVVGMEIGSPTKEATTIPKGKENLMSGSVQINGTYGYVVREKFSSREFGSLETPN